MAFIQQPIAAPTSIGDIQITLYDPGEGSAATGGIPNVQGVHYTVQVVYSDGSVRALSGNLVPHLTTTQINGLLSFVAAMRVKANAEILP